MTCYLKNHTRDVRGLSLAILHKPVLNYIALFVNEALAGHFLGLLQAHDVERRNHLGRAFPW